MKQSDEMMPFGAYKGQAFGELRASYLLWLMDQDWIDKWPQVKSYVAANRERLEKEADRESSKREYAKRKTSRIW